MRRSPSPIAIERARNVPDPRRRSLTRAVLLLILALALGQGCASGPPAPPIVTAEDVAQAQQNGTLEALLDRIEVELASPNLKPDQRAQLEVLQGQVKEKLAAQLAAEVRAELGASEARIGDTLNKKVIEDQRGRIAPMAEWSPTAHQAMHDELDAEIVKTDAAIEEREARLATLEEDDVAGRIQLIDEIASLEHPDRPNAGSLAEKRSALLADLNQEATAAIEAENYDEARRLLETARDIDPEDMGTVAQLASVDTKVFERDFFRALEEGDPDAAYALLTSIAADESFDLIRPHLAPSAGVMSDYYASLGAEATAAGDVPEAWRRFGQAREIHALLDDGPSKPPKEEAAFVKLLMQEYEKARKSEQLGLAWGYLNVVEFLQGDSPALRRQLRESREAVLQRAIKRLSVSSFETPESTNSEFGNNVASGIVQHLFKAIPNDVRMIERDQLDDIMREKNLDAATGGPGLAAADYLVQGTILEAKVDSIDKIGKKTMRVVTEQIEGPNPEYNVWLNLSSKDRKKTPEPPKIVLRPRKEDVTIELTHHRKVGIFSVSYRVIDAETAKVVFADSVRAKAQHDDTSSEGVELGDFKMEFKLASLPSDIEILATLADEVSAEIGTKLAEVLADPEMTYRQNADRFAREANFAGAAQQYAYAIVLAQRKQKPTDDLELALRSACIASSGR
jgi:curli biogenesis system outer membrane secretion channel CsgG